MIWRTEEPNPKEEEERSRKCRSKDMIWKTQFGKCMKMKTVWRIEELELKEEEERSGKHRSEEEKQRFGERRTIWKTKGRSEGAERRSKK